MFQPTVLAEQRRRPRVQLSLPVRLRWQGPLGHVLEVTETLDVSRGGLLFYRAEPCAVNTRVWVTFPFQAGIAGAQPEWAARVVRVKTTPAGGHLVAVEFEAPRRSVASVDRFNRRTNERTPLALPIRVRPADTPWPEETMTIDVSNGGVLFRSARHYAVGDILHVTVTYGPWVAAGEEAVSAGEIKARVVRTEPVPDSVEQRVAIARIPQEQP